MKKPYIPINCDFHDLLEELSTLNKACEILYEDEDGAERVIHGHIVDLYTKDHQEFLRLNSSKILRLDQIKRVNERPAR